MNFLEDEKVNKILLGVIIVLQIITISIVVLCRDCDDATNENKQVDEISFVEEENNEVIDNKINYKIKVDIKGAVKKSGVYELNSDSRVIDVINIAGGLKSNASTKYLNLSRKITDEMIIYVYTENQVKNMNEKEEIKDTCYCPTIECIKCEGSSIVVPSEDNNVDKSENDVLGKISLNSASKEELLTLTGIGESKADAIIKYRNDNNGFKVIEDIMNVTGIGEALYNKIKDNITI